MIAEAARPTVPPIHPVDLLGPSLHVALVMWKLWVILALVGACQLGFQLHARRRLRRSGILEVDSMSGREFELRLGVLFKQMGYHGRVLGRSSGDYGADLILDRGGHRVVVQAKRWNRNVGIKAVQEALGAREYYCADDALVVTNRRFTKAARALADKSGVELWDRGRLIRALDETRRSGALDAVTA